MATRDDAGILIFDWDESGKITFGSFQGTVPSTANKFAANCILVGAAGFYANSGTVASPSFQSVNDISTSEISDGAVTLAKLAAGVTPGFVAKYGGKFTTAGGDATETITATGATGTDIAIVTVQTAGVTPRSIVSAVPGTNNITVTLSGDPSTDHILSWVVFRAAA